MKAGFSTRTHAAPCSIAHTKGATVDETRIDTVFGSGHAIRHAACILACVLACKQHTLDAHA